MKIGNIDLFKILLIILLGGFLYLYQQNSNIGRFQLAGDGYSVIDTKTGETYEEDSGYYISTIHPILK